MLVLLALAGEARTQTIRATLTNIPASATRVVVLVDGGSISVPTPSSQAISTGSSSLVMSVGVPAGGPYRLRVATEDASANLLRSGKATNLSVTSGQTVPVTLGLSDVTGSLDSSTPASASEGSPVTIRLNFSDAGNVLSVGASECWIDWGTNSSSLINRKSGDITASSATSYQCTVSLSTPASSTALYYRAGTYAYDFLYDRMYPLLLYPSDTPLQMTLSAANTISLTVLNIPVTATRLVALVDGGTLSSAAAASKSVSGVSSTVLSLGVPPGGTYRVRVIAHDSSSKVLRSGKATSTGGAASINLSDVAVAVDSSTPSSVNAGSQTSIKLNVTDAGDVLKTGDSQCWIDYSTVSSSLNGRQYGTLTAVGGSVYQCTVGLAAPVGGTTLYYRLGNYAIEFVYERISPMLSWPAATPQTISLTSAGVISLTVGNIPSTAIRLVVVVDGGSLSSPLVTPQTISAGMSSYAMSVSVAAGGPYRVRTLAHDADITILRSGKTSGVSVSGGGSTAASITLGDISVALDAGTPASAGPGTPVTILVNVTDPGDFIGVGEGYCWVDYGTDSSNLSESIFGTVINTGGSNYQGSVSLTTPANSPTLFYQFGTYAYDFIADHLTATIAWPPGSSLQMSLLTTNPTIGTDPVGLMFSVDSTGYTSAQTFTWASGSTHTLAASSPQDLSGIRYFLSSWSDGGAATHTVTVPSLSAITARYAVESPTSVTVTTNPPGLTITVDGASYISPVTLSWTVGASHTIAATASQGSGGTRYTFASWSDAGAVSHTINTPTGAIAYTAQFTTQYLLSTAVSPAGAGSITASPSSTDGYYSAGAPVQFTANAGAGYQFSGWSGDLGGATNPQTLSASAARSVTATFAALAGVTVATNPAGLSFTVDGVAYTAPQTFSWTTGSTHTIATTPSQGSGGTRYVFASWSDAGAVSHTITTPTGAIAYTAQFTTQYLLSTAVSPAGAGSITASPSATDGYYNAGAPVQFTANAGAGYQFSVWSGDLVGATNPQTLSASAARSVTATFTALAGVTVATNPAGLGFAVDGVAYTAPQTFGWTTGSTHTIATTSPQGGGGTRYTFASWSDAGAVSHTITTPTRAIAYTAQFTTQYLLSTTVSPAGAGSISASPGSGDGYYNAGTPVQLTATPGSIYSFVSWTGDLTSSANPQGLALPAPKSVTANFGGHRPTVVNVSPVSGASLDQVFTFTYGDSYGYQQLAVTNVLFNTAFGAASSCYLAYNRGLNVVYLLDDAGSGLLTGVTPGSGGSTSNSQCTIYGAGSSATGSGNNLTLKLHLGFTPAFMGVKSVFAAASEVAGGNSGWQTVGSWTATPWPNNKPTAEGISPGSGNTANRTFTFTFSDVDSYRDLSVMNVLINNFLDGRHACYMAYSQPLQTLYLVNDAGDGLLPAFPLNGAGSAGNSQCTINGAGSSASGSGKSLTLTLNITFSTSFGGKKVFYLAARDLVDNNSGWQALGTWAVPPVAATSPTVDSMLLARSSGIGMRFYFYFSDSKGWQDLGVANILLNDFLDGRHGCYLAYSRPMNVLYLVNDTGDGLMPGILVPGDGMLGNSQCSVADPRVSGSGNTLTLSMVINFNSGFIGNKVWYAAVRDVLENSSGWQTVGSYSVQP